MKKRFSKKNREKIDQHNKKRHHCKIWVLGPCQSKLSSITHVCHLLAVVVVLHNIRNKGCKQNEWCLAAHRACRVALLLTGKPSTIERFFLPCLSWMELKTSIRDSRRRKTLISQKRNVQGKKTPRVSSHAASSSLYVCPLISVCWAITI